MLKKQEVEYIIIDRKVACAFLHESSHLRCQFVPKEIREMKFKLTTGQETTIDQIVEEAKRRVDCLANYIDAAFAVEREKTNV
jgi:hypothetical protein